ncbi:MAG: diacylglycerol/lipid kinase family protein [Brevundimonas sp.]|uniref:diacylglycerol/lipid kinase family protein n=1 Tax=Brevundimonas sp. TaxID=1871086 RepID=UPI0039197E0B
MNTPAAVLASLMTSIGNDHAQGNNAARPPESSQERSPDGASGDGARHEGDGGGGGEAAPATSVLKTACVPLTRVHALVNPLSGGVDARATEQMREALSEYAFESEVFELGENGFAETIEQAFAGGPDLVIVLAGDGTARAIAAKAGADGPLVAPLPGGTMNMLPKALYHTADWKLALERLLSEGQVRPVSGGTLDGHPFYCAAIIGSPALWAPAREALRGWRIKRAWLYGLRAFKRAFSGRIRFRLDGGRTERAEALVLISPLISRAMETPTGLEAAIMNLNDAADAFRLAARALFDDWRADPMVRTRPSRRIDIAARSRIPAILDGESVALEAFAEARFLPVAFRTLAPPPEQGDGV